VSDKDEIDWFDRLRISFAFAAVFAETGQFNAHKHRASQTFSFPSLHNRNGRCLFFGCRCRVELFKTKEGIDIVLGAHERGGGG